jgi:Transglutaminase-like superfamily
MAWWKSTVWPLLTSWRTFLRLSAVDRWCFFGACILLPSTAAAFCCLGFRRWQATLERWAPRPVDGTPQPAADDRAYRTAWLVQVAARFCAGRESCLAQSLVLWWLLRQRGLVSELRVGVRKRGGQLQAHAWVEYRDLVLNDRGDGSLPFVSFDRPLLALESGSA